MESRIQNKESMEAFQAEADEKRKSSNKRSRRIDSDTTSTDTERPTGWELHRPVFSLTWDDGRQEWSTHLGGHTHMDCIVYPNFVSECETDVFEDGEDEYVNALAGYATDKGFRRIECSCSPHQGVSCVIFQLCLTHLDKVERLHMIRLDEGCTKAGLETAPRQKECAHYLLSFVVRNDVKLRRPK